MTRGLLGLGFCVQGFRCFPWTAINFFLRTALTPLLPPSSSSKTSPIFPWSENPYTASFPTLSTSEAPMIRGLLGLGFCVQFRCFPWTAINFFLKDDLNAAPSTLQLLQNSVNLLMVGKPLYGVVSNAVYIGGQHCIPYIAIGGQPLPHFLILIYFPFFPFSQTLIFF